jgi:DNA-directed RNA polymerase subunit RPC12/RpoP
MESSEFAMVDAPRQIVCVDCGGDAFLLDRLEDGEQVEAGTILSYRCKDCMDRWDIEIGEE